MTTGRRLLVRLADVADDVASRLRTIVAGSMILEDPTDPAELREACGQKG
jgi:hypothetical protein